MIKMKPLNEPGSNPHHEIIENDTYTVEQCKREIMYHYCNGNRRPLGLWGTVGIGKTEGVHQTVLELTKLYREQGYISDKENFGLKVLHPSHYTPTDLRGAPVVDREKEVTRFFTTDLLPNEKLDGKYGILLLDEFNQCSPVMMDLFQQLLLDGRIGNYQIPKGWLIVVAGNRKEDLTGVIPLRPAIANRLEHLQIVHSQTEVVAYMIRNNVHKDIVFFLADPANSKFIHMMNRDSNSGAWPSPRSWIAANARYLDGRPIAPSVGKDAARALRNHTLVRDQLPNIPDILEKGHNSKERLNIKELGLMYSTAISLAYSVKTPIDGLHAFEWFARETSESKAEFITMFWTILEAHADNINIKQDLYNVLPVDFILKIAHLTMQLTL